MCQEIKNKLIHLRLKSFLNYSRPDDLPFIWEERFSDIDIALAFAPMVMDFNEKKKEIEDEFDSIIDVAEYIHLSSYEVRNIMENLINGDLHVILKCLLALCLRRREVLRNESDFDALCKMYTELPEYGDELYLKEYLANTLIELTMERTLDKIVSLIKDKRNKSTRVLLFDGLQKMNNDINVRKIIQSFSGIPELRSAVEYALLKDTI